MAHQMMMVNPKRVRADVIEANDFPEVSQQYQVSAVPRVVINNSVYFEGALPEDAFLDAIKSVVDSAQP